MAILRVKELRKMSPEERSKKLNELYAELRKLKAKAAAGGALESPGRLREIKRTIARILTIQREEELKEGGHGRKPSQSSSP
ncbi:MAG: 50S ribosomal protein L29 [Candidatus Nezhaarchaeota archaeon]|nr:50S ribosomal protein L29 [Candidatus Nezhaarchaeota archaeon]